MRKKNSTAASGTLPKTKRPRIDQPNPEDAIEHATRLKSDFAAVYDFTHDHNAAARKKISQNATRKIRERVEAGILPGLEGSAQRSPEQSQEGYHEEAFTQKPFMRN